MEQVKFVRNVSNVSNVNRGIAEYRLYAVFMKDTRKNILSAPMQTYGANILTLRTIF